MWIYTKSRGEHDRRFILNLDLCSRINLSQLGERWFIEVMLGSETLPIASTTSQAQTEALLKLIFDSLHAGEKALDLDALPMETESRNKARDGQVPISA